MRKEAFKILPCEVCGNTLFLPLFKKDSLYGSTKRLLKKKLKEMRHLLVYVCQKTI